MGFLTLHLVRVLLKGKKNSKFLNFSNNIFSRIFWLIALSCSFVCCFILFYQLIIKIDRNPIIVDRPDTAVHIKDVRK